MESEAQIWQQASDTIKRVSNGSVPELAVVCGSGLAETFNVINEQASIGYSEIPGFIQPKITGHIGKLVSG